MTGMVSAAWAVPEWMKKLMTLWVRNMIWAVSRRGTMAIKAAE